MILIDANLLIYAVNSDAPHHRAARKWLEETLSGQSHVGLPWVCLLAFLRITTHPGVFARPLRSRQALDIMNEWLDLPYVGAVFPGDHHWPILRNLVQLNGTGGNLVTDAHIAAMAIELGATICSADYDFRRFSGVRHINPLDENP